MHASLRHGRDVGGPALRELTFHERAALLKAVGGMLRENRDELYALSMRTGSTLFESRFDVDTDAEAAARNPLFGGIVAHGYLVDSFAAGLFVSPEYGPVLANYGIDDLRFVTPVKPGDELTVTLTCKAITPRGDSAHGEVRWDAQVTKQDGSVAAQYDVLTMVAKE